MAEADGVDLGGRLTAEIYLAITGDSLGVRTDPASGRPLWRADEGHGAEMDPSEG